MGQTTSNTPAANSITQTVEGTTIWDEASLKYWFAVAADQAEVEADDEASTIFAPSSGTPSATFNDLSAADAGENVIREAFTTAATAISNIANISFTAATDFDDADIKIVGADNYVTASGGGIYGSMDFPGTNLDGFFAPLTGEYESFLLLNPQLAIMTMGPSTGGGHFSLTTVMHELGHGIGLGHPHDSGNGTTTLPGATDDRADDVPLDNERYTIMSYESGGLNQDSPRTFGHAVTPMAIDIAALHQLYGARDFNTTDTTYTLTDAKSAALDTTGPSISIGEAWYGIWDTGGDGDAIEYNGAKDTILNLNAATLSTTDDATTTKWIDLLKSTTAFNGLSGELKNDLANAEYHAGGFFSRVIDGGNAQLGGYSIAKGVVIENATGGSGADIIVGNAADNRLEAKDGADVVLGSAGDDTIIAGNGDDTVAGGEGDDEIFGGGGEDTALFSDVCENYDIVKDEASGTITITHVDGTMEDGTDILTSIEKAKFSNGIVDLTEDDPGCPPIDFIFLVDLSGSYSDDLPNFQAAALSIASAVRGADPDSQFAVASFIDLPISPYGDAGDYTYRPELALTDDESAFAAAIGGLSTRSGNDTPESQLFALDRAARGIGLNLREGSQKIILIATDAPAHSAADYGVSEADLAAFLDDNDIEVIGGEAPREVAEDGDVGDTDPDFIDGIADPLFRSFVEAAGLGSATPIFAVTSGTSAYYETLSASFPGKAPVVPLSSSGDDIADAVSAALAEITGEVTDTGGSDSELLEGSDDVDDVILGLGGDDTILGFAGDDLLEGGADDDSLEGGADNDTLRGGTGDDEADGGTGDDLLEGGLGEDTMKGGTGEDTFAGTVAELDGDTIEDFEEGDKILLRFAAVAAIAGVFDGTMTELSFDIDGDGTPDALLHLLGEVDVSRLGIEIDGTDSTIAFVEAAADQLIAGTDGDDVLAGDTGDDTVFGKHGDDDIFGDNGNDLLFGQEGSDTVAGGGGDDLVKGNEGDDKVLGNAGDDTLFGNSGDDMVFGQDGDDRASGGSGDDTVLGGDGNDTLYGRSGDDTLAGEDGDDRMFGLSGDDLLSGGDGDDWGRGGTGNDDMKGGDGDDTLLGNSGDDTIVGNVGDDRVGGGTGDDILRGGQDDDQVLGNSGNDLMFGDSGDDILFAGSGNDTVAGGTGANYAVGGDGIDTFVLDADGRVVIEDFTAGVDLLGLDGIDFEDLSFAGNRIRDDEGDVLARLLNGIDTTTLDESDFVLV